MGKVSMENDVNLEYGMQLISSQLREQHWDTDEDKYDRHEGMQMFPNQNDLDIDRSSDDQSTPQDTLPDVE
jgi:hypothetical protein